MLLSDNIREIAYQTDYFTTIKFLKIYPKFNTDKFWEEKWNKMYPNEIYVPFLTDQDCFLLKERERFVLIFYRNECHECGSFGLYKNILYEKYFKVFIYLIIK